jgi:hypothetical protein
VDSEAALPDPLEGELVVEGRIEGQLAGAQSAPAGPAQGRIRELLGA